MKKSQFTSLTQSVDLLNKSSNNILNQSQQEIQQQQHIINKTSYCLLAKESQNDKSFSLKTIESNCVDSLEINIKQFIYSRITKNMIYKSGSFGVLDNSCNNNTDQQQTDDTSATSTSPSQTNNNNILSCFYTLIEVPIKTTNSNNTNKPSKTKTTSSTTLSSSDLILLEGSGIEDSDELIEKNNRFQDDLENLDNLVDFSINDDIDDIVNDVLLDSNTNPQANTEETTISTSITEETVTTTTMLEYYLCLVCETENDVNLGLFHLEISEFCLSLKHLITSNVNNGGSGGGSISDGGSDNNNNNNISIMIQQKLTNWYSMCIDYISRSIKILDKNIQYILHATLTGKTFKIICSNKSISNDITSFLKTISIVNLSSTEISPNQFIIKPDEIQHDTNNDTNDDFFTIEIVENPENIELILNKQIDNLFCKKWSGKYLDNINNSIVLRNISEDLKLKVIQEFNMFRRMIDLSTLNNYLLYKSFLFLSCSDNSDILLYLLKKDNIQDIKEIIIVLENQLNKIKN